MLYDIVYIAWGVVDYADKFHIRTVCYITMIFNNEFGTYGFALSVFTKIYCPLYATLYVKYFSTVTVTAQ